MFYYFYTYLRVGSKKDGLRKQLLCINCNNHPCKWRRGFMALRNPHHLCETYVREMKRGGKERRKRSQARRDDQD